MKGKYPADLFIIGFITNIFGRFFFLFFFALFLLMIGIWVKACLMIGLGLLGLDIVLSFSEQLRIKYTFLNSDNPSFTMFQDAVLSKDWKNNVMNIVESQINENDGNDEQGEV